jgi:hypothetical protein
MAAHMFGVLFTGAVTGAVLFVPMLAAKTALDALWRRLGVM